MKKTIIVTGEPDLSEVTLYSICLTDIQIIGSSAWIS